jgi:hypothetical protein
MSSMAILGAAGSEAPCAPALENRALTHHDDMRDANVRPVRSQNCINVRSLLRLSVCQNTNNCNGLQDLKVAEVL